jgi:hypothetical protein
LYAIIRRMGKFCESHKQIQPCAQCLEVASIRLKSIEIGAGQLTREQLRVLATQALYSIEGPRLALAAIESVNAASA